MQNCSETIVPYVNTLPFWRKLQYPFLLFNIYLLFYTYRFLEIVYHPRFSATDMVPPAGLEPANRGRYSENGQEQS